MTPRSPGMMFRSFVRRACALLALACLAPLCQAQPATAGGRYPDKPLRLVLAFPPGGPTELVARVLAQKLGEQLGQSVLVDNRPGANGNISAVALSPALYKKLSYDVRTDFAPVALTAVIPLVLVVHPSLPVHTPAEFLAYARAQGERLTFGSAGNGNITHLGAFLLLKGQGLQATHAPYKGSAPALTDLVGGQLQFMTDTVNSALPFIRDKRLRALAVTSLKRTSVLPEVPTLSETVAPGFEVGAWQGLLVPARTPHEIVNRLNAELLKALASPDVRAKLAQQGAEPLGSTPAEYGAYIDSEIRRWTEVVRQTGAALD